MAGKNTGLRGPHSTRIGHIVEEKRCSKHRLSELSKALGRGFTGQEIARINGLLTLGCEFRRMHFDGVVSTQSVKRTLASIAEADDDAAAQLAFDCDAVTEALLAEAKWRHEGTVQAYAGTALAKLSAGTARPGRKAHWYQEHVVSDGLRLWFELDGPASSAAGESKEERTESPLFRWTVGLLSEIEGLEEFSSSKARVMLKKAREGF